MRNKDQRRKKGNGVLLKPNSSKLIVGYDLGSSFSQISYCYMDSGEVETLSSVAGGDSYNIPTALCKRKGVNQWFFGREAQKAFDEGQGILVEDLLGLAVDGEPVRLEGEDYNPVALLTLFLKRSLSILSMVSSPDKIGVFVLTCEYLDRRLMEVLGQAVGGLRLKTENIYFQSYAESFYSYMLYQPAELWNYASLLWDYDRKRIKVYRMVCNRRTEPVAVFIETQDYPFSFSEDGEDKTPQALDREFLELAGGICGGELISSIYLIGEAYSEEWMKDSLKYLCRNRRVFLGSNLYSKGACYGGKERLNPGEEGITHVFLGNDKLKANIGMKVFRQGEESYLALLDAGVNWYEARMDMEFYIQEENAVELLITPLIAKNGKQVRITLEGLKHFPSRIRLSLYLPKENILRAEIEDLGFGEFRPATNHVWTEEMEIYQ